MLIAMPTAEHRETVTVPAGMVDRAATKERVVTRSGRVSVPPARLVQEMGTAAMEEEPQELCPAKVSFLVALTNMADQEEEGLDNEIACVSAGLGSAGMSNKDELGCVGAGLGSGFDHTSELHDMKFKQAMKLVDKKNWEKAVNEEHKLMKKHKVWEEVKREDVPADAKVLTLTWAMKKKSKGKF